ncbi:MAG: discoidin domain-containing protein [Clostridia bacterium]|nr:discoidin domain-containing protein [Clostridia bacterium]
MKKVLSAILVLALALSCMVVTVSAAELENLTKRATSWEATSGDAAKAGDLDAATAWVADTAQATITMGIDIPLPMGYIEIDFGDTVANEFKIQVSSDATSWTDVVTETGNLSAKYVHEWTSATQRYVKIEILATDEDKPATIAEIVTRQSKDKEDTSAASAYPSSGVKPADGSYLIHGDIIGLAEGWGGNPATGAAAAFDGDVNTFFDPLGTGNGWAGIDAGEEMTLTKIVVHPRADNLARYYGAEIDGSNDPEFNDYTPIYISLDEATEFGYIEIDAEDFDDIGSFRYYRYFNTLSHGDVAEVELYGVPSGDAPAAETDAPVETEAEAVETEAPETEAEAVETEAEAVETEAPAETEPEAVEEPEAPQTFDFGVAAVVAAIVSLAGYAVSKKHYALKRFVSV